MLPRLIGDHVPFIFQIFCWFPSRERVLTFNVDSLCNTLLDVLQKWFPLIFSTTLGMLFSIQWGGGRGREIRLWKDGCFVQGCVYNPPLPSPPPGRGPPPPPPGRLGSERMDVLSKAVCITFSTAGLGWGQSWLLGFCSFLLYHALFFFF